MHIPRLCVLFGNNIHILSKERAEKSPSRGALNVLGSCQPLAQKMGTSEEVPIFSLSKKSCMDFFDKLKPPSILPQAKCYYLKSLKNQAFQTAVHPTRGGPCPLELPCGSVIQPLCGVF